MFVFWEALGLLFYLGHVMRTLANRQVFRETEYGSDVFVNNRMSSILLSSHEKNLRGFIGHWYSHFLILHNSWAQGDLCPGLMMVTVPPTLRSKLSGPGTLTSRSSRSTTECLCGITLVVPRESWPAREETGPWSVRNQSSTED